MTAQVLAQLDVVAEKGAANAAADVAAESQSLPAEMHGFHVTIDGEMVELPIAEFAGNVFLGMVEPLEFFLVQFLEGDQITLREQLGLHAVR